MIFLVVLGHLGYDDWGLEINKMIYSFHMPVFIFLSGYFTSQDTDRGKHIKWLKQTLLIYIAAQFAHFILSIGIGIIQAFLKQGDFDTSLLSWRVLISPYLALWYLVCLIYWRLSVWSIFSKTNDIVLLCISCILSFVSGFIPIDYDFAFQRAFSFFPFFVTGMIFRKHGFMSQLCKIPYKYAFAGLLLGLLMARFLPMYMPKSHYSFLSDLFYRIIQSCLGFVLCLLILRVARIDFVGRFAKYGLYTLWIYIGHTFLIIIGRTVFPYLGISFNLITALILTCLYCALFIFMAKTYHACQKSKSIT